MWLHYLDLKVGEGVLAMLRVKLEFSVSQYLGKSQDIR
jgi:hypothetical protein